MEQFAKIVHEWSPRLVSLAQGIVGGREAAEDVVQDALVKAYRKRHTWRGEGAMSTWLYRIVYREAISTVRSRREFSRELPDVPDESFTGFGDSSSFSGGENFSGGGAEWAVTEENIARMQKALELLPPLDRTLVTLFYMDDKSVREAAEICGLSEANVKVRLHRARGRLRELMGR